jgi:hypothetical protein
MCKFPIDRRTYKTMKTLTTKDTDISNPDVSAMTTEQVLDALEECLRDIDLELQRKAAILAELEKRGFDRKQIYVPVKGDTH